MDKKSFKINTGWRGISCTELTPFGNLFYLLSFPLALRPLLFAPRLVVGRWWLVAGRWWLVSEFKLTVSGSWLLLLTFKGLIVTFSNCHIFKLSHFQIVTFSNSIFTSSHLLIFSSSHPHIFTSSHPQISPSPSAVYRSFILLCN